MITNEKPMLVSIYTLYVNCMLRVRNLGQPNHITASDCCQYPAVTGVVTRGGGVSWRCHEHEGMRTIDGDLGAVVIKVPR